MNQSVKYKLHMKLEHDGEILEINDKVENFVLEDYIFEHDLEAYTIIEFNMEVIK